jgi:hypothetical protein
LYIEGHLMKGSLHTDELLAEVVKTFGEVIAREGYEIQPSLG